MQRQPYWLPDTLLERTELRTTTWANGQHKMAAHLEIRRSEKFISFLFNTFELCVAIEA